MLLQQLFFITQLAEQNIINLKNALTAVINTEFNINSTAP